MHTQEELDRRVGLRDELIAVGDRRRELRSALDEVSVELRRLLPEARDAGWGVTHLAGWTGMTRKAIYDVLADIESSSRDGATSGSPTHEEITHEQHER